MNIIEKLGITPLPWKQVPRFDIYQHDVINDTGDLIAIGKNEDHDIDNANTVLIAATPEMLEALIDLVLFHEKYETCYEATGKHHIKAVKKAIEIIEKATGKSWEEIKELLNEKD